MKAGSKIAYENVTRDVITCAQFIDNCNYLILGTSCGLLYIYTVTEQPPSSASSSDPLADKTHFIRKQASRSKQNGLIRDNQLRYSFLNKETRNTPIPIFTFERKLIFHTSAVGKIEYSSVYQTLITTSKEGTVVFWDWPSRSLIRRRDFKEAIVALMINEKNGDVLVITGRKMFVITLSGVLLAKLESRSVEYFSAGYIDTPLGVVEDNYIFTGHMNGEINVWIMEPMEIRERRDNLFKDRKPTCDKSESYKCAFKPSDGLENKDGFYTLKRVYGWNNSHALGIKRGGTITSFCISEDQTRLYVGNKNGDVVVWFSIWDSTSEGKDFGNAKKCMICQTNFGFNILGNKHACAMCKKVMCINCAKGDFLIGEASLKKMSKICPGCHDLRFKQRRSILYDFF